MGVYLKEQASTYVPSPINVADNLYNRERPDIANDPDVITGGQESRDELDNEIGAGVGTVAGEIADLEGRVGAVETGKADTAHTHTSAQISDATMNAGWANPGNGGKLVKTRADGSLYILTGSITDPGHATNKSYVDSKVQSVETALADKVDFADTSRALSESTYGTVPRRDTGSNHIRVGGGQLLSYHAAPKSYVDEQVSDRATADSVSSLEARLAALEARLDAAGIPPAP